MILRLICIILSLLSLSGCADGTCLDADDFGFARFTVSARYDSSDLQGQQDNQIAPWKNTGYTVNGAPLVVVVKNWNAHDNANTADQLSAWCPWYGGNSGATGLSSLLGNLGSVIPIGNINTFNNGLSKICENLAVCEWVGNEMCTDTLDAQIINAPCLLTKGVGLYALITRPGSNPNANNATMVNPSGVALHVGAKHDDYVLYDVDSNGKYAPAGGLIYQYTNPALYNNGGLYFKILDKHYGDNSGQYLVTVKSGLNNNIPDPIQFITNMVAQYFFGSSAFLNNPGDDRNQSALTAIFTGVQLSNTGVVQSIYQSLIQNPFYKNFVRGCLTLYVMLTGLYYLAGLLQVTTKEMIVRIVKITIVATLLDPNLGWSFFHDYLFVFFIEGVQQMINIIQTAAATGPGPTSIISLMLAPQTLTKLISLLFTSGAGIVYIILYFLIFIFIISITFRAAVLYLNCLIMIGMIIIMGPIFLCFMLFGWTKSLFENWLKQLISYALQPIILITALAFVSILVRHEIYATLGFPVCREVFLPSVFDTIDPSGKSSSIFSWWFPVPMNGHFSNDLVTIPVPEAHHVLDAEGKKTGAYCQAYECSEPRYVQLPFLDPNNSSDMRRKDTFFEGSFTQILGLIYIIVLCYLLNKFNESAVSIARALTETSQNATSMDRATQTPGFTDMLKGIGKAAQSAGSMMSNRGGINASAPGEGGAPDAPSPKTPEAPAAPEEKAEDTVVATKEVQVPVIEARGGLEGSKDDGSGTASRSSVSNSLEGKGFESLAAAKENLTKPLELKNMPASPPSEPYDMKEFDAKAVSNVNKKSGSIDDFDVKYSNKEGPKKEPSLEDAKKNLLKPLEIKMPKKPESSKVSASLSVEDVVEKKRPVSAPPRIEKASVPLERKAPPPVIDQPKVSEKITVENVVERTRPVSAPARIEKTSDTLEGAAPSPLQATAAAKEEISVATTIENAPPSESPLPPPPPLKPKATKKELGYLKSTVSSRAKERSKSAPTKLGGEGKATASATPPKVVSPGVKQSASAPSSPKVVTPPMKNSTSAPSATRSSYMGHTKSSAVRSDGNIENRKTQEGLKAKDQAKRPQSPALTKSASAPSSPRGTQNKGVSTARSELELGLTKEPQSRRPEIEQKKAADLAKRPTSQGSKASSVPSSPGAVKPVSSPPSPTRPKKKK